MVHGDVAEAYPAEGQNIGAAGSFLDGMILTGDVLLVSKMVVWLHVGIRRGRPWNHQKEIPPKRFWVQALQDAAALLMVSLGLESNVSTRGAEFFARG